MKNTADEHPIDRYYRECRERYAAAHQKWREAIQRGADSAEVNRLYEAMNDAGNTGD